MPRTFQSSRTAKSFTGIKDKKINILQYVDKKDDAGLEVKGYEDVFGYSLWANYRSISGSEYFFNLIDGESSSAVFTVNHHKEIESGMMIKFRDKVFKIVYIDDKEGYKNDLKLHCYYATLD